jgi:hypothetical protein
MPEFLALLLMSPQFQRVAQEKAKAATKSRERVNPGDVMRLPASYVESKEEQVEAVSYLRTRLGKIDVMRRAAERQCEAISALPAALLREFFNFGGQGNG